MAEEEETDIVGNDDAVKEETAKEPAEKKKEEKETEEKPQEDKPETEKEEAKPKEATKEAPKPAPKAETKPMTKIELPTMTGSREIRKVPMSRLRDTAAKRLKLAQNTYAMLTTFNECDMSALTALRKQMKDQFLEAHGVKLGFMSAFIRASVMSLQKYPAINAVIDGKDIVYHDYVDMSIAVSAPKGLVVPVLRNCESMSFAKIEMVNNKIIIDHGRLSGKSQKGKDCLRRDVRWYFHYH